MNISLPCSLCTPAMLTHSSTERPATSFSSASSSLSEVASGKSVSSAEGAAAGAAAGASASAIFLRGPRSVSPPRQPSAADASPLTQLAAELGGVHAEIRQLLRKIAWLDGAFLAADVMQANGSCVTGSSHAMLASHCATGSSSPSGQRLFVGPGPRSAPTRAVTARERRAFAAIPRRLLASVAPRLVGASALQRVRRGRVVAVAVLAPPRRLDVARQVGARR